eukprot:CAMPEP_0172546932 /NCGR_PEP_ID=MMETSP1067-20121228/16602_1 /TAXON_ID=265564 ORGANISM="Thalassiosira punctigera, Strain Tpunct2005C2" /NCGR_SAMPLE_ID=MMETSP1067 /ASSEMBLY_ACC=CAM_ASM_000444 /LENGTH=61 /DNA_ID=CAMNT_0013333939 /DNA_START=118 /DNA_END=303 /DNA_ORIENTATION=-
MRDMSSKSKDMEPSSTKPANFFAYLCLNAFDLEALAEEEMLASLPYAILDDLLLEDEGGPV